MFRIGWEGYEEQLQWDWDKKKWVVLQKLPDDSECEFYNQCGEFGVCQRQKLKPPKCECIDGYEPKVFQQWSQGYWSDGCVRRTKWRCEMNSNDARENVAEDKFKMVKLIKLPDFGDIVLEASETCEERCLNNCSCAAYANVTGIGCMIWGRDLVDMQSFDNGGNMLFVRLAGSQHGMIIHFLISVLLLVRVCDD